jgi:hypothetical protein
MVSLWEHVLLFVVVSLIVSLVYNGLRQDDLRTIVMLGLKRFVYFMAASLVLAVGSFYLVKHL